MKYHRKISCSVFFAFCFLIGNLSAQVSFEAYSGVKQVVQGEYFDVSFTLLNADGVNFSPPKFTNFRLVQGPQRSVSTSIINGQRSSEITYSYLIEAEEPGTFSIGYATIKVGNETMRTNTLRITVNKRNEQSIEELAAGADIFVRAIPSTLEAYPGQQILIDYKLYSSVGVDHYSVAAESDYQGFFAQPLRRYRGRTQSETIGGKTYSTLIFRRVAVFPQVIDSLEIQPIRLQVGLANQDRTTSSGWLRTPTKVISLNSDPVTIAVKPIPAGAPESFCGGVGTFSLKTGFDMISMTTDDAMTFTLTLSGNGDVKRLEPPVWINNDSFELYNPSTVEEKVFENQGELVAQKTFEYQVLPYYPGQFNLTPEVTVYDPDSSAFVTLTGSTIPLKVRPGSGKLRPKETEIKPAADVAVMSPIKEEVRLKSSKAFFINTPAFWGLTIPAPLMLLIGWAMRQMRIRKANIDPIALRRSKAMKVAAERLNTAKNYLDQGANREFFDEVSKASLGFLNDRMGIPPSDHKKDIIRKALGDKGVNQQTIDQFIDLLKQCELALFAGQANDSAKKEVYDQAMSILAELGTVGERA